MAVQMGGPVKLLSTEETLVNLDVAVQDSVSVQVVGTIEPFAADLTEKFLVLWVGMCEDVSLELVLSAKPLSTDLTRDGYLFALSSLHVSQ